jgi:hypothetical protein
VAKFRDVLLNSIPKLTKELGVVLKDLDFLNNFRSFKVESQTIAANTEAKYRNQLNVIPTTMIINKQTGNGLVTAGDTSWDNNYVYVKNHDASNSVTVTITFLR